MGRIDILAAAAAAIVAVLGAGPASAQTAPLAKQPAAAPAVASICVRDLGSARCGQYQNRLLLAAAQRSASRSDPATLGEIGRRQLAMLIDSIS